MFNKGDDIVISGKQARILDIKNWNGRRFIIAIDEDGETILEDYYKVAEHSNQEELLEYFPVVEIDRYERRYKLPFVFATKTLTETLNEINNLSQMTQRLLREHGIIIDSIDNIKGAIVITVVIPERADVKYIANELKRIINRNIKTKISNQLEEAYIRITSDDGELYRATMATSITALKTNTILATATGESITDAVRALSDDIEIIEEEIEEEYERLYGDTRSQSGWIRSGTEPRSTGSGNEEKGRNGTCKDSTTSSGGSDAGVRQRVGVSGEDRKGNRSESSGTNHTGSF